MIYNNRYIYICDVIQSRYLCTILTRHTHHRFKAPKLSPAWGVQDQLRRFDLRSVKAFWVILFAHHRLNSRILEKT